MLLGTVPLPWEVVDSETYQKLMSSPLGRAALRLLTRDPHARASIQEIHGLLCTSEDPNTERLNAPLTAK